MLRSPAALVAASLFLVLQACGSTAPRGSDGGAPQDGGLPPRYVGELEVGTFTPQASGQVGLTDEIQFTLPADGKNFIVIVHGTEGVIYQLNGLLAPDGFALNGQVVCDMSFFGSFNGPNRTVQAESVGSFLVPDSDNPQIPGHLAPGAYKFKVEAMKQEGMSGAPDINPVRVEVVYRVGEVPAEGVLDLNLYFTGAGDVTAATAPTTAKIQDALTKLQEHYDLAGISIGEIRYYDAPSDLQVLNTIMGSGSDYSKLLRNSADKPAGINLFLVGEIKSPLGGAGTVLGMAGGIPGPYLRQGTARSGIALVIDPPQGGPERGTVWAHEMGHFLGLFHSTEMFAQFMACAHDPLADTPENDTTNIMYYTGQGGTKFTPHQTDIMRGNPMVKPLAAAKPTPRLAAKRREPVAAEEPLSRMLGDLDVTPPRHLVDALGGAPALLRAARDPSLDLYRRERAVSFLEYYPSPETLTFLTSLAAAEGAPMPLRRSAVYTLAFTYGRTRPKVVTDRLSSWLGHAAPGLREAAARALAWMGGPIERRLLRQALAREQDGYLRQVLEKRLMK